MAAAVTDGSPRQPVRCYTLQPLLREELDDRLTLCVEEYPAVSLLPAQNKHHKRIGSNFKFFHVTSYAANGFQLAGLFQGTPKTMPARRL